MNYEQSKAIVYLRNSLQSCTQSSVPLQEVIKVVYEWTKNKQKKQKWVRLDENSPRPPVGSTVRIEDNYLYGTAPRVTIGSCYKVASHSIIVPFAFFVRNEMGKSSPVHTNEVSLLVEE